MHLFQLGHSFPSVYALVEEDILGSQFQEGVSREHEEELPGTPLIVWPDLRDMVPDVTCARPECRYGCIGYHKPKRPRQICPERFAWLLVLGFTHTS